MRALLERDPTIFQPDTGLFGGTIAYF